MVKLVKIFDMIFILYGYMDRFIYVLMYVLYEMNVKYRIMCIFFYIFILKKKYEWDEEYEKDIKFYVYLFICKKMLLIIYF